MNQDTYRVFAQVYDQDFQLEIPRSFFRTLRPLIRAQRQGLPVLELGCGSGLLTQRLAETGASVIAVDGAPAMLRLARKRCASHRSQVTFLHSRLEHLDLREVSALALTSGDVANHMPRLTALQKYFRAVRRALIDGGLFVFDTITEYCFENYWPDNTHLLEGPLGDVLMSCDWEPSRKRGVATITSYVRRSRSTFTRSRTVLHEYFYSDKQLLSSLRTAGFEQIWKRPWSPWRWQDREARRHRDLWAARVADPARRVRADSLSRYGFRRLL